MIKKTIFIILFFIPYYLMASDSLEVKKLFAIKTDMISLPFLFGESKYFAMSVEKNVCKKQSAQLSILNYWYYSDYKTYQTAQIIIEYKFYFKEIGKGFFSGFYSKYINYHERSYKQYDEYYNSLVQLKPHEKLQLEYNKKGLGFGLTGGYQFFFNKHLLVELITGIGIRRYFSINNLFGDMSSLNKNNFELDGRFSLNVGYGF